MELLSVPSVPSVPYSYIVKEYLCPSISILRYTTSWRSRAQLLIGGEWVAAASGETLRSINPSDGDSGPQLAWPEPLM
ncbi:MAG: hypothetical protein U0401_03055 [Anaerolineae bacterium]